MTYRDVIHEDELKIGRSPRAPDYEFRVGGRRRFFLETVYLTNEVENLILFFPNSQRTSRPANIGAAKIQGWECSFSTWIWSSFQLSANYTRLETKDTSEIPFYKGNQLPSGPLQ